MYDTRGNITETQRIGKLFSAPLVIVTTAGFEASCANPAVCNKPKWTRDARGSQTDYTYDETTGQVLTVTRPAPVSGGIIRPKITMT